MVLTTSASGNAQHGQKITLGDDDFDIYTVYIPSGSKHDLRPLKAMMVVLGTDKSTLLLPHNSPVHFHAIAYPPPTTYVQSNDDWDIILTVMSYNLQPLDALPTTATGEPPSLMFNISGPIIHTTHEGEECLMVDVCAEDYWLVGAPLNHLGSPFKDTVVVGQHTSATGTFATRGRSSDKSKAVLMFDLSMATLLDSTNATLHTFVFYTNPPNDNSLIHRLMKQAHKRYLSAMASASAVPAPPSPEIIPSSVPSMISSSPAPSDPPAPSPPPRQPSAVPETLVRSSPRLRQQREDREARTAQVPRVVAALVLQRLTALGALSKTSPASNALSTKRSTPAKRSKTSASTAPKKAKSRSKASGKAKKAATKTALRPTLLRSATQRGKLRSGLLA